jgi:hypothetical protein
MRSLRTAVVRPSGESELLTPSRRDAIHAQRRLHADFINRLVRDAQLAGDVHSGIDPALAANAILGLVNWIYTWYDPRGYADSASIGRLYAELIVKALEFANLDDLSSDRDGIA